MKQEVKQTELLTDREDYISPDCNIVKLETESFICTSVKPNAPGSNEDGWDPDEEIEGEEFESE